MIIQNLVRAGFYLDSVALMRTSAVLKQRPGIDEAVLMIGTDTNKQILRDARVLDEAVAKSATPSDLIIAVRATDADAAAQCIEQAAFALDSRSSSDADATQAAPRTLAGAATQSGNANLALISTAGAFAAREARAALAEGLNVMLFSDNVALADELALKHDATARGLIVMGPDCGTAYINGVPLAFANSVTNGSYGVVAASGTGLQEVSVLLTRAGLGISHGIGVGGRDLSDAVGALSTLTALDWLEADVNTTHIILISKPPGANTAAKVFERLSAMTKPVTVCLLGADDAGATANNVSITRTLKQCVEVASGIPMDTPIALPAAAEARAGSIRGLFCGGTLCAEARIVLSGAGAQVASNAPVDAASINDHASGTNGHQLFDLGADEFTVGRPHPMIEPTVRDAPLQAALSDPNVAVVLLDVVLGYGAHLDPAGEIARVLRAHGATRPNIVAYVCGTETDPQGFHAQSQKLLSAGVMLAPSNADAATLALTVCTS